MMENGFEDYASGPLAVGSIIYRMRYSLLGRGIMTAGFIAALLQRNLQISAKECRAIIWGIGWWAIV